MNETPQPDVLYHPPEDLSPEEARTWAMLAHLSVLLNLLTGFLGVLAALGIYLAYRGRSRYVAFQAWQAFLFQLIFWGGGTLLAASTWVVSSILTAILVGCLLMPLACVFSLLPIGAVVYGVLGALECNQGNDFRYYLVADWAESFELS